MRETEDVCFRLDLVILGGGKGRCGCCHRGQPLDQHCNLHIQSTLRGVNLLQTCLSSSEVNLNVRLEVTIRCQFS